MVLFEYREKVFLFFGADDSLSLDSQQSSLAWCGTYSFYGGTYLYNCDSTIGVVHSVESLADWYSALSSSLTGDVDSSTKSTGGATIVRSTSRFPETASTRPSIIATSVSAHRGLSGAAIGGIAVGGAIILVAIVAGITAACCLRRRRRRQRQENEQAAATLSLMPRPPAVFDPTQDPQQAMVQPEKPYSAFKPSYLNPPSPVSHQHYHHHHAGGPPSPIQPYDPSQELIHRASTVNTAVSPHPLHLEETPPKDLAGPDAVGYFPPPPSPPGGYSELSEGDAGARMMAKNPVTGIPTQLRAGSPPSRIYSSVHEVPATTPEAVKVGRWELPSKP